MELQSTTGKVKWLHVIVYYLLACAISWPFFWWRDILHWQGFNAPGILKTVSIMWGPGMAALMCLYLFRKSHRRTVSLLGNNPVRSLIFWFAPLVLLAILGVREGSGAVSHTLPLLISVMAVFTIMGEEVGWRGFLQDALRPLKPAQRYVLIGVLWEAWHFTNRVHGKTLMQATLLVGLFLIVTIGLSFLIGMAVEKSKSIVVATAIHGWVDLMFEMPGITSYISAAFAVLLWIYLLKTWKVTKEVEQKKSD
ncbi:MAG: CPBP family intramembrane metalloprotease [Taibaiella sp.]|nr:CPBP family intramembrane metalloprotease [Taibaiella sp.]